MRRARSGRCTGSALAFAIGVVGDLVGAVPAVRVTRNHSDRTKTKACNQRSQIEREIQRTQILKTLRHVQSSSLASRGSPSSSLPRPVSRCSESKAASRFSTGSSPTCSIHAACCSRVRCGLGGSSKRCVACCCAKRSSSLVRARPIRSVKRIRSRRGRESRASRLSRRDARHAGRVYARVAGGSGADPGLLQSNHGSNTYNCSVQEPKRYSCSQRIKSLTPASTGRQARVTSRPRHARHQPSVPCRSVERAPGIFEEDAARCTLPKPRSRRRSGGSPAQRDVSNVLSMRTRRGWG